MNLQTVECFETSNVDIGKGIFGFLRSLERTIERKTMWFYRHFGTNIDPSMIDRVRLCDYNDASKIRFCAPASDELISTKNPNVYAKHETLSNNSPLSKNKSSFISIPSKCLRDPDGAGCRDLRSLGRIDTQLPGIGTMREEPGIGTMSEEDDIHSPVEIPSAAPHTNIFLTPVPSAPIGAIVSYSPTRYMCYGNHDSFKQAGSRGDEMTNVRGKWCESEMPSVSLEPSGSPIIFIAGGKEGEAGYFPSSQPSQYPSDSPSSKPSQFPSDFPGSQTSQYPSDFPSSKPSQFPSLFPSSQPSQLPSYFPSSQPSQYPSEEPTSGDWGAPGLLFSGDDELESESPSSSPTLASETPSETPSETSGSPLGSPSDSPSASPSGSPSGSPSDVPSGSPSDSPDSSPSATPSASPSDVPSASPSESPSGSFFPSSVPSAVPTDSHAQSASPSGNPSASPSGSPSGAPSASPSDTPSTSPSRSPSGSPSAIASDQPMTQLPTLSEKPSEKPTELPVEQPRNSPESTNQPFEKSFEPSLSQDPTGIVRLQSVAPTDCYDKYGITEADIVDQTGSDEPIPTDTMKIIDGQTSSVTIEITQLWSEDTSLNVFVQYHSNKHDSICEPISDFSYQDKMTKDLECYDGWTDIGIFIYYDEELTLEDCQECRPPDSDDENIISYYFELPCEPICESLEPTESPVVQVPDTFQRIQTPTDQPVETPTKSDPSEQPTQSTEQPVEPSDLPTGAPTTEPSENPSSSYFPSEEPTDLPSGSMGPSGNPSEQPTNAPTGAPTGNPTASPSGEPTPSPTAPPTNTPTSAPTTEPSENPSSSYFPSEEPTDLPSESMGPSGNPSKQPTNAPTDVPTDAPTSAPTFAPTFAPTIAPTKAPTEPQIILTPMPSTPITSPPNAEPNTPTEVPDSTTTPSTQLFPTVVPTLNPFESIQPTDCYDKYGITEADIVDQAGSDKPIPTDAIKVINRKNSSLTIEVTQLWSEDTSLNVFVQYHSNIKDNICEPISDFSYQDKMTKDLECYDGWTDIGIFIYYDEKLTLEDCQECRPPDSDDENIVAYYFEVSNELSNESL